MPFLTARIIGDGEPTGEADGALVPWWSFTKTALAATALRLVGQGRLPLDEPLADRPYTLRHLLQHRAGLPDYGPLLDYHDAVRRGDPPWPAEELLERVAADRLEFRPGQGWRYSNVGYLLVRGMIEDATGEPIGRALRRLIFDELGLTSVRLMTTAADLAATAWGNPNRYHPDWVYHGLLAGTPADAARFLHRLLTGRLLERALLEQMTTAHPLDVPMPPERPWQTAGYGLGLMIGRTAAGLAIGHSGGGPGSICAVYHFPDRRPCCTAAAFAEGAAEGAAESEAVRLAQPP